MVDVDLKNTFPSQTAPRNTVATSILGRDKFRKLIVLLLLLISVPTALFAPNFGPVLISAVHDAYVQVATLVALTLFMVTLLERQFRIDIAKFLTQHSKWHVPTAACFGSLPGCGGAIVMITQFCRGHLSFGALTASLITTMGDAAFLLLAQKPTIAFMVIGIQFIVGISCGYVIDRAFGTNFLRPKKPTTNTPTFVSRCNNNVTIRFTPLEMIWLVLLVPGLGLAFMNAFQVDPATWFSNQARFSMLIPWFGFLAGLLCICMWVYRASARYVLSNDNDFGSGDDAGNAPQNRPPNSFQKAIGDTNFVFFWVVISFLVFESFLLLTGFEPIKLFSAALVLLPLFAILVGFIPGCGPQIIVTTMYIADYIPLSAQIGNAISNDGDALIPALALAPKQALLATLFSAIPAVVVAYGWFATFEADLVSLFLH